MSKRPKNMDLNQLAKCIVDEATGEIEPEPEIDEKKKAAIESGRLGGLKGGKSRAEKLTPEERADIARTAAEARWRKNS
ncbi:histone H1 [Nitrosomonas sp.]|uniref:histone H1 n=1 Tax=Nitrosomonas sp. TaxID=42353 RepID=UPI00374DD906